MDGICKGEKVDRYGFLEIIGDVCGEVMGIPSEKCSKKVHTAVRPLYIIRDRAVCIVRD